LVVVGVPALVPQYRLPTGVAGTEAEVDDGGEVEVVVGGGAIVDDPHAANAALVPRNEITAASLGRPDVQAFRTRFDGQYSLFLTSAGFGSVHVAAGVGGRQ
jgi:hypothetical protein